MYRCNHYHISLIISIFACKKTHPLQMQIVNMTMLHLQNIQISHASMIMIKNVRYFEDLQTHIRETEEKQLPVKHKVTQPEHRHIDGGITIHKTERRPTLLHLILSQLKMCELDKQVATDSISAFHLSQIIRHSFNYLQLP